MKIKLNLGCGDKLYPASEGWVNVDVVPKENVNEIKGISKGFDIEGSMVAKPYFIKAELQNLEMFDDNVVDEIHGYHIIEHFYRDEVQGVLKEWLRVLKPDGVIALEQPDVIKCAANFLAGIINGDDQLSYNKGFLGFYGDGTSKEPYMGHHWGWHGGTLGGQLEQAGYTNIVAKTPVTHMGPVRDFRIEARKPTNE